MTSRKRVPKRDRPLCSARCRDGHPCRARIALNPHTGKLSSRCRMHGGLSTGPRTPEGLKRVCANLGPTWGSRVRSDPLGP
jgi:hypothetical protein